MGRRDEGLAFLLRYENVAWYEAGTVRILDRRIYPIRVEYVTCHSHREVAQAITDMVTQSGGPYTAASMGMALAAYEARDLAEGEMLAFLEQAAYTLSHARPTTAAKMGRVAQRSLETARKALAQGIHGEALAECPGAAGGELRPARCAGGLSGGSDALPCHRDDPVLCGVHHRGLPAGVPPPGQ